MTDTPMTVGDAVAELLAAGAAVSLVPRYGTPCTDLSMDRLRACIAALPGGVRVHIYWHGHGGGDAWDPRHYEMRVAELPDRAPYPVGSAMISGADVSIFPLTDTDTDTDTDTARELSDDRSVPGSASAVVAAP